MRFILARNNDTLLNMYSSSEQQRIEQAIVFATTELRKIEDLSKPVLFHSIRVGTYLYFHRYETDLVITGYLHDLIEDTPQTQQTISENFGQNVGILVAANSKNASIKESIERNEELIKRCVEHSEQAAIIKAADIIDNYHYYKSLAQDKGILYCQNNVKFFQKYIKPTYTDRIFSELFTLVV